MHAEQGWGAVARCAQAVAARRRKEEGLEVRHRAVLEGLPPALPELFLDFVDSAADIAWVPTRRATKLRLLCLRSAAECWLGERELATLSGAASCLAVEAPRLGMAVAGLVDGGRQVRGVGAQAGCCAGRAKAPRPARVPCRPVECSSWPA